MRPLIRWGHCDHATNMTQAIPSQNRNAKSIWYMEGFKQVRDDGANVIGAGVYNAARGISHSINPRWVWRHRRHPSITPAEPAALASAFLLMGQEQDEIIANDSQASISMIRNIGTLRKHCSNASTRSRLKMLPPGFLPV